MSLAKLTINSFLNYSNNTLFDNLKLPDGIDKDLLIDNIIMEGGEFELVYANLDFMKSAIGVWSSKHYRTFEKWLNALNIEYNPLENYDRIEEWEDDHTGKRSGETTTSRSDNTTASNQSSASTIRSDNTTASNQSNASNNRSDNTTTSDSSTNSGSITNTQSDTTTNNVSAYDSTDLVKESQSVDSGNSSSSSSGNTSSSSSERNSSSSSGNTLTKSSDTNKSSSIDKTTSNGNVVTNDSDTYKDTKTGRAHGNIGVTTSQQMLESELNIAKWNIYKHITDLFLQEFCIMVYI